MPSSSLWQILNPDGSPNLFNEGSIGQSTVGSGTGPEWHDVRIILCLPPELPGDYVLVDTPVNHHDHPDRVLFSLGPGGRQLFESGLRGVWERQHRELRPVQSDHREGYRRGF